LSSTAVGDRALARGVNSTALGQLSAALAPNSVALGFGSVASQANTVSVGCGDVGCPNGGPALRRITNVAPGIAPTDAVNVSQLTGMETQITQLTTSIFEVRREERQGIAAVAAMAYAPTPTRPGGTTFQINGSVFESEGGVGVAVNHRLSWTAIPVYISAAYGNGGGRQSVGRVGLGFEW
jgi:autotransporter adhesin